MTQHTSLPHRLGALVCSLLLASACEPSEPSDPSQYYRAPEAPVGEPPRAPSEPEPPVKIAWFGHSLIQRPGDEPLDLPYLVRELHRSALAAGRTRIPESPQHSFILLNRHLGHHLDGPGDAEARLRELAGEGITHVVGIGFMHMLGEGLFARPSLSLWLSRLKLDYDSPRRHTAHIYRFMELMKRHTPKATWVSYVGPALANNVVPQDAIDARYACIEQTAREGGVPAISAHVGRAFRRAEAAAKHHPDLTLRLNTADSLHLAPQGAVLAASVLYQRIYGVDPVGLSVPEPYYSQLADTDEERKRLVILLQQVARDTRAEYVAECSDAARLPEDTRALERLREAP